MNLPSTDSLELQEREDWTGNGRQGSRHNGNTSTMVGLYEEENFTRNLSDEEGDELIKREGQRRKASKHHQGGGCCSCFLVFALAGVLLSLLCLSAINTYFLWKAGLFQLPASLETLLSSVNLKGSDDGRLHLTVVSHYGTCVDVQSKKADSLSELLKAAAEAVGVPVEYVVLERPGQHIYETPRNQNALKGGGPIQHASRRPDKLYTYRSKESNVSLCELSFSNSDIFNLLLRPLRGDHVHYAFSIFINGRVLKQFYDRPVDQWIYEGRHLHQVYPHWGLHSGQPGYFDDSLIHVHPATSWQWFRFSEGFGANLGAFLEAVGVWVWEDESVRYPKHRPIPYPINATRPAYEVVLDMPNGTIYNDTKEHVNANCEWPEDEYEKGRILVWPRDGHRWRLFYWPHYADVKNYHILDRGFERVWLYQNHGRIVLSYDDGSFVPPPLAPEIEQKMLHYGISNGFDGLPYPFPNKPLPLE